VISQPTARTMMTLLKAVIQHGTGAAAAQLNHPLGGKTGTTSDYTDAWFLGFSPSVTCGVWVGYDSRQSLGEKETGAKAALPIWMTLMRAAIQGKDDEQFPGSVKANPAPKTAPAPPSATQQPSSPKSEPPANSSEPPANSEPTSKSPPHVRSGAALAAARLPAARPAASLSVRPVKATARTGPFKAPSVKTAAQTTPAEKPRVQTVAKLAVPPATRSKPLVRPALSPPAAPVKTRGAVKPALAAVPVEN
jgi:penicillin-binding protein 1A